MDEKALDENWAHGAEGVPAAKGGDLALGVGRLGTGRERGGVGEGGGNGSHAVADARQRMYVMLGSQRTAKTCKGKYDLFNVGSEAEGALFIVTYWT